jgi:WD40 repeat protein
MAYSGRYSKCDQGEYFAVGGSGSNDAHFFHSDSLSKIAVLTSLPKAVFCIDWANLSNRIALGCGDGTVRVFKLENVSN